VEPARPTLDWLSRSRTAGPPRLGSRCGFRPFYGYESAPGAEVEPGGQPGEAQERGAVLVAGPMAVLRPVVEPVSSRKPAPGEASDASTGTESHLRPGWTGGAPRGSGFRCGFRPIYRNGVAPEAGVDRRDPPRLGSRCGFRPFYGYEFAPGAEVEPGGRRARHKRGRRPRGRPHGRAEARGGTGQQPKTRSRCGFRRFYGNGVAPEAGVEPARPTLDWLGRSPQPAPGEAFAPSTGTKPHLRPGWSGGPPAARLQVSLPPLLRVRIRT